MAETEAIVESVKAYVVDADEVTHKIVELLKPTVKEIARGRSKAFWKGVVVMACVEMFYYQYRLAKLQAESKREAQNNSGMTS